MFHRIDKMTVEGPTFLNVTFKDGAFCRYDVAPLIVQYSGIFGALRNPILFSQAKIAAGGYGVVWNADIDLCADDIYEQIAVSSAAQNKQRDCQMTAEDKRE